MYIRPLILGHTSDHGTYILSLQWYIRLLAEAGLLHFLLHCIIFPPPSSFHHKGCCTCHWLILDPKSQVACGVCISPNQAYCVAFHSWFCYFIGQSVSSDQKRIKSLPAPSNIQSRITFYHAISRDDPIQRQFLSPNHKRCPNPGPRRRYA